MAMSNSVIILLTALIQLLVSTPGGCQNSVCSPCLCYSLTSGQVAICNGATSRLTSVPQHLPSNINFLDMRTNQIVSLPESSLMRYTKITTLSLRGNKLIFVSSRAFLSNTNLVTLDLSNNNLFEIPVDLFERLSKLERLNLNNNQLTHISIGAFAGLENLKHLSLDGNDLTTVPLDAVKPLKSLESLEIKGNRIHCDCSVAWMKDYKPLVGSLDGSNGLTCETPNSLSGTRLSQVDLISLNCAPPVVEAVNPIIAGFKGELGIELRCISSGDPPPEIKWFFHGEELTDSIFYRIPDNGSLLIVAMVPQLAGDYSCFAENLMGNHSDIVTLQYAGAHLPSFIVTPEDTHHFEEESALLECVVDQFTDSVHWEKDGVVVEYSDRVEELPGEGLLVRNAVVEDSGVYACVATNEEGPVRATAFLNITGPLLSCEGVLSREDVDRLKLAIEFSINATQLQLRQRTHSPSALLRRLRFPQGGLIEHLKAAEIFDQAIAMVRARLLSNQTTDSVPAELSQCELEVLSELSGCEEHKRTADCTGCYHQQYRTLDGTCNNLDSPTQGASEIPFLRLLPPEYEDGIGLPPGWSKPKPSARLISQRIIAAKQLTPSNEFTLMLMQLGQFLDHDMDIAPASPSGIVFNSAEPDELNSCDNICHNDAPCYPISVPEDDPRIKRECLPFTRSSAVCGTGAQSLLVGNSGIHREQLNGITSYIDGSNIYGSSPYHAQSLRLLDGTGRLRNGLTVEGFPDKYFLPFDNKSLVECSTGEANAHRSDCFLGGDVRVNEQVGLTTMHTLFFREHNRVVKVLAGLNPDWDGEKLYQETRRIVIAEWQNIVYSEYLPKILGYGAIEEYSGYDPSIDATIANAFATAAYRFGHSQIMPLFPRRDSNYEPASTGPLLLQNAFFAPFRLLEEGGIDPLVRGLISTPVKMRLSHQGLNNNLTEALFNQAHEISLDLGALNIQRGRDHGLPNYNRWRVFCGLPEASTISDLRNEISNATVRDRLREVYGDDPNEIDLWVGGLLEDTLPGAQLGPTFQCIISNQFYRLRDGDRFYFERQGQFTPDQVVQLKQATLSRIICDNSDNITMAPVDSMLLQSREEFVSCENLPTVNLDLWQECSECGCGYVEREKRSVLLEDEFQALNERMMALEERFQEKFTPRE